MKDRLKKMLTTNVVLKISSVFLAFLLWILVSNSQNAVQTKSVKVDIQYINEAALEQAGYIVVSRPSSIIITAEVRKNDYYRVTADSFTATADLSKHMGEQLSSQLVQVEVKKSKVGEEENIIKNWNYPKEGAWITVKMDELQTKEMPIDLVQVGEVDHSYVLNKDSLTIDPQTVIVRGPKSEFGSLTAVKAELDLSQFSPEKSELVLPLKFYDANNNVIESQNLEMQPSELTVKAGVKQLKEVSVIFEGVVGEAAAGYKYSEIFCDTKTIALAGLKASLANISSITIPRDVLDITGATQTIEKQVDITPYLPDGVEVYNSNIVTVRIIVEKLDDKVYQIPASQITWIGRQELYSYQISSGFVPVKLRAFQEDLDRFDLSQVQLSADVSGLGIGTHDIRFSTNIGAGFTVIEPPTAQIQVTSVTNPSESVQADSGTNPSESAQSESVTDPSESAQAESVTDPSESAQAESVTDPNKSDAIGNADISSGSNDAGNVADPGKSDSIESEDPLAGVDSIASIPNANAALGNSQSSDISGIPEEKAGADRILDSPKETFP